MEVPCSKARGRPRKTWSDCVKADMNACSLGGIDPKNRTAWRSDEEFHWLRYLFKPTPYLSFHHFAVATRKKVIMSLDNANPIVYERSSEREKRPEDEDDDVEDGFDDREVFDLIRSINDPEHPLTLEELNVVDCDSVHVNDDESSVEVEFTPTIPHCSMATLIGLSIRVKLLRALPSRFKVDVRISPGSHASEVAVNKQLADKERVAAALENMHLLSVVNQCLTTSRHSG